MIPFIMYSSLYQVKVPFNVLKVMSLSNDESQCQYKGSFMHSVWDQNLGISWIPWEFATVNISDTRIIRQERDCTDCNSNSLI